jgi:tartrate-resistant acid phosphatase type 5
MKNLRQFFCISIYLLLLFVLIGSCNKKYAFSDGPWTAENIAVDSISFIVVGDWGKDGGEVQKPVADQLDVFSKQFNAQFIISTGDNFYPAGISSVTDAHWKSSFENIYNKAGHQIPWYPVLGNHDYQSNPQAEIDYSLQSNRWKLPARYHSFKENMNDSSSALFVFTDTSPFVEEYYGRQMSDLKQQDSAAQYKWLRQTLSGSHDNWKIVIGHHPVYSVGKHGNTSELIQRFKPLLDQTRSDFYIAGHDHSLQHILIPNDPVNYLISGAGAENTYVHPTDNSLFARATPGFLVMTLYPHRANFYFYNQRGELLYRRQLLK